MNLQSLLIKLGLSKPSFTYSYLPDEHHIEILNCWTKTPEDLWYYRYLKHHFSKYITADNSLLLCSVFGPKKIIAESQSHIKLFYTGENVDRYSEYNDHCQNLADLAFGFDYLDDKNYQRFPYWLEHFFTHDVTPQMIRKEIANFVQTNICKDEHKKFASLVSSHDDGKIRTILFNALNKIDKVESGGRYLNNTSALKDQFDNDKKRFIGQYKFNICPENSNREGYVTEKVFEALKSNTIPIYWGSNNNPEPNILNKDAILFYDGPDSLPALNRQIEELHRNPKIYKEFLSQPKFQPNADEYIIHLFDSLHSKIHDVLTKND